MDLKKFKLISALLLAGALLFLSVIMIYTKNQADNLPFSAAEDLSALFASRGIELPPEIVPLKRETLPVYSYPAADGTEAQELAETIGSSKRIAANLTENGYRFRLENGAMADVSKHLTIDYALDNRALEKPSATYPPTDAALVKAEAFLSRFNTGSDDDAPRCTYVLAGYATIGTNTILNFDIFLNGVKVHGSSLSVYQDEDGNVLRASGTAAFSPLKKESGVKHYDIINILKAELDYVSEGGTAGAKIESIDSFYVKSMSADGERILFIPAWRITYSNGEMRIYETVSGETP